MTEKTFVKGLHVLTTLAQSSEPRTLTNLSDQLGLTKSNMRRLLSTLIEEGFAVQESEKGKYRATLKLWELASGILNDADVVTEARRLMPRLLAATGETVHLSILMGWEVAYLDKLEGSHAVRSYTQIGGRAPAWCVATGKALLSHCHFDPGDWDREFERFTPNTLTTAKQLQNEFEIIREAGIAFNRCEWRDDVLGAASPIFDASGRATAAIGISGPSARLSLRDLQSHAPEVIEAAGEISRSLGYVARF